MTAEPVATEPLAIAREILAPYGLTVRTEAGIHLVVRLPPATAAPAGAAADRSASPPLDVVAVSASRYEILGSAPGFRFAIDQRSIESTPDLGDDPLRVLQRLPGAAASGASAMTHFRGGEEGEIGIELNGQRLFDPFHIRDYQNIFSAVDARAIQGVEVYTGAFPVRYGDRMSGMVVMESLDAARAPYSEIGVSVYNTSVLTTGSHGGKHWLFSARRGNLDLVIDPQYGSPSYYDVFAEFAVDLTSSARLSIDVLQADDRADIVLEPDPAELEQVRSDTRNTQLWVQLDNRWSDKLSSATVLSAVRFENFRRGTVNDEELVSGTVHDRRSARLVALRQDYSYAGSETHWLQWGFEMRQSRGDYDYRNSAAYHGVAGLLPALPPSSERALTAAPEGASYALYFADRWQLAGRTTLEWGLRWDDQTYTAIPSDSQLSPRVALLHRLPTGTELRVAWGRYHQAQDIHELQVEDGVAEFWPAQRADHFVVGLRHVFGNAVSLRLEAFRKTMDNVRPRFENLFNPLGLIPEIQPDRVRLAPSSATSRGIELSIDARTGPVDWWASLVRSEAVDRIDGREELRSWDQRDAFQAGLNWRGEAWNVALAASVHSGWPTTDLVLVGDGTDASGEPIYRAVPGPRNARRYETFASLDLRIARTWQLPRGSLVAFLEIANLTDRRNPCCRDFDLDESEDGAPLLDGDVNYWLPRLPAIGVRWQF